jgi:hypothetical protein
MVILKPTSQFLHHYTVTLLFPCLEHMVLRLCGLDLLPVGRIILMRCVSISHSTVLSDKCRPGTVCSITVPYFTKKPSTS